MEKQTRYILRKVKKRWITVSLTSLAIIVGGLLATNEVTADEMNQHTMDIIQKTKLEEEDSSTQSQINTTEAELDTAINLKEEVANYSKEGSKTDSNQDTPLSVKTSEKEDNSIQSRSSFSDTLAEATENLEDKKNFVEVVNGYVRYYDKETGEEKDAYAPQYQEKLSLQNTEFTRFNQIHSISDQSLEVIDSYLTADSWYRPKAILQNGHRWVTSRETDFRPLLMTWWPDKQTQVNYLNYMKQEGLAKSIHYTEDMSQEYLNRVANEVQKNIERKISIERNTDWLRTTISNFIKTQPNWNHLTESDTSEGEKDHLQGGALLYSNSKRTLHANSDYRLLNRTPTNQTGVPRYFKDNSIGGYEFLLANDVDNSNPIVQAEQLNWLHYLMNWGSIVANDPEANFDGVRIDAVDNVNADLLQIASDYFKAYYGVDKNEAAALNHLSILEAWSHNDPHYNKDTKGAQLPIDNQLRLSLLYAFMRPLAERSGMEPTITNSLINRSNNTEKENKGIASYVFVRAHDSEVQTVIAKIIKDNINPKTDGLTFTLDELKQAFTIYNQDMQKAEKQYTQFNIPTAYALMLSNKDVITRVYYGDLYTDDGQYMAKKSPYYDAIDTLLRARIKYVAGGQRMQITYVKGDSSMSENSYKGVLSSVRYGSGAFTSEDKGTQATRTQGMAVITTNNPSLKLADTDIVRVAMGAAHKRQAYRPLLMTTQNGITSYLEDHQIPQELIKYTDENGILTFTSKDIAGYSNPQVSGFLAVWVPVGAKAGQDVRVKPNSKTYQQKDGQVYRANAAFDSQVIYEGFSNFQDFVTKPSEYTNVKIAENVQLFKDWGITSFEMPPQYVSSTDGSFLDSIILNGYAFTDRYDLAMSKNNKYGSKDDLIRALKELHKNGIQVIADWVPNQIYTLPGKEVVTATRVNNYGTYREEAEIKELLYVANTKGGGQYQAQYGGAFLDELKAKYPQLFLRKQISTGKAMDPSVKIKSWKASYFNGTNILGRGAYYVLKDWAKDEYFYIKNKGKYFLPKQLTNQQTWTGFYRNGREIGYYSTSGYQAKNSFIQAEKGNIYYFDCNGHMIRGGRYTMNNDTYYFLPNGIGIFDGIVSEKGRYFYFDKMGRLAKGGYRQFENNKWRYFSPEGYMAVGLAKIENAFQYFDRKGFQVKGEFVTLANGKKMYFDENSGNAILNSFKEIGQNIWYYFDNQGYAVTGRQVINGQELYFRADGRQVKGEWVRLPNGEWAYYDPNSGVRIRNQRKPLKNISL